MLAKHWSEGLLKLAIWLSGIVDYETAEQILCQVGQLYMSDSSIWRQVQRWGKSLEEASHQAKASRPMVAEGWQAARRMAEPAGRLGVAMDGGMVHIRHEGWKELKVGCVFDVQTRLEPDPLTDEMKECGQAVGLSYVGRLGGPEELGQVMWREAERRGWEYAQESQAVGDGAAWIWNQVRQHFYTSHQVVDWCHAVEHLATAAKLLHGEGTEASKRWLKQQKERLYRGGAGRIAKTLRWEAEQRESGEGLRREAGYFGEHRRRMQYMEMREQGWLIGSGPVESGIKQFKGHLAGAGMRWSCEGIGHILPVCEAVLSQRFEEVWAAATTRH